MDEAVNPSEGTGALSIDDAVGLLAEPPKGSVEDANPDEVELEDTEEVEVEAEAGAEAEADVEDSEDDEEEREEAEPETFEVKVNGEMQRVTLEELQSGYSREQDYRKKTADHAEAVRQFEAERQTTQQSAEEAQALAQRLNVALPLAQRVLEGKWANVDWQQAAQTMDPRQYNSLRAEYDRDVQTLNQLVQTQQQATQKAQEDQTRQFEQHRSSELTRLHEAIPEFQTEEGKAKKVAEMESYLRDLGDPNPAATVKSLPSAMHFLVIRDAMEAWNGRKNVEQAKSRKAPKVTKPGRTKPPQGGSEASLKKKLARTGDPMVAVELLLTGDG